MLFMHLDSKCRWYNINTRADGAHFIFITTHLEWALSAAESPSSTALVHSYSARPVFLHFPVSQLPIFHPQSLTYYFAIMHWENNTNQRTMSKGSYHHICLSTCIYTWESWFPSLVHGPTVPLGKGSSSTCAPGPLSSHLLKISV